ncbi:MAG: DUF2779 domain-containing protein [bacterium]|nr:DUF2779 domain-containing protein [bacterium]
MVISKSEYMMFLKHPAWIWLKKHDKSKLPEPDANLQAIFDAGNLFESYAEKLFPDAVRIGFNNYNEYLSLPKRTEEVLKKGAKVILQGRFEVDGITCIIDVLKIVGDGVFDLYEIKGSTSAKVEHEHDLAFQTVVLEDSGLKIRNISVIHINSEYKRDGDIVIEDLTSTTDITDKVRSRIDATRENIKEAHKVIDSSKMPDPSPRYIGMSGLTEWMHIYYALKGESETYSIYNLQSPRPKIIGELEDLGITLLSEIPDDIKLTEKQQRQVDAVKEDKRTIDKKKIANFLDGFEYPLYFFDYETLSDVVPPFDGIRPYQQVPFQYSLHIQKKPGDELKHKEYLHTKNTHPGSDVIKHLKKDIGKKGSIIVWYESFEKSCNTALGEMFPDEKDFMASVNDRIVDLMIPFSKGWFVDKDFFGSASIKKVLPALIPALSHKDLSISDGGTAQRIWMDTILRGHNKKDKKKLMDDLLEYCKLDTLAMVEILNFLWELEGKKAATVKIDEKVFVQDKLL